VSRLTIGIIQKRHVVLGRILHQEECFHSDVLVEIPDQPVVTSIRSAQRAELDGDTLYICGTKSVEDEWFLCLYENEWKAASAVRDIARLVWKLNNEPAPPLDCLLCQPFSVIG